MESRTAFMVILAFLGTVSAAKLPYIVGGKEAKVGAWPWQGSVQYADSHICGCVVVADQWVVTSARCVQSPFQILYKVVLGLHDQTDETIGKPVAYDVDTLIPHKGWGSDPLFNFDVAVIKLSKKIDFSNKFIKMVEMANKTDNFDGANCTMTGWGSTEGGSRAVSPTLQEAAVTVVTPTTCRGYWGDDRINDGMICAFKKGVAGACRGDSGGAMVCPADTPSGYKLAGTASWGTIDCSTLDPSVFTRVSFYIDWIRDKIGA